MAQCRLAPRGLSSSLVAPPLGPSTSAFLPLKHWNPSSLLSKNRCSRGIRLVAEAQSVKTPPTGKFIGKLGNDSPATRAAAGASAGTAASQVASAILPPHVQRTLKPANAFWPLALAIVVPVLGGVLVSSLASPLQAWYRDLQKPSWDPPDWMFGAVWSALYVLMGVASFLVWADGHWAKQSAPLQLYAWQLALNFSWPIVFFRLHRILSGAVILGVLVCLVNATMRSFYAVNRVAGWLLLPYQAWVVFAFILNIALWRLNSSNGNALSGASWSATPRSGDW